MIRFIEDAEERKKISAEILESLTDWFEVESSRKKYIEESAGQPFWVWVDKSGNRRVDASVNAEGNVGVDAGDNPGVNAGFLCLKETGRQTMELAVMGVRAEYHRKGVGRRLFAAARDYAVQKGYEFIQVKTVRAGVYEDYDITNAFYKSLGFKELEVFPDYWDEANPCQIYVMSLKSTLNTIAARHSYRGKFLQESVPIEDLMTIAKAGTDAPSGCNMQTTEVVIVTDPDVLRKVKEQLDPPVAQTAPAMIAVLTRRINAYRDKCFAVQDYSAAIQNMLLAIVELGYQSCWYEGHITDDDRICDKIAAILQIPEEYDVVCILPVGKAEEEFHAPSKKPLSERVHLNSW